MSEWVGVYKECQSIPTERHEQSISQYEGGALEGNWNQRQWRDVTELKKEGEGEKKQHQLNTMGNNIQLFKTKYWQKVTRKISQWYER